MADDDRKNERVKRRNYLLPRPIVGFIKNEIVRQKGHEHLDDSDIVSLINAVAKDVRSEIKVRLHRRHDKVPLQQLVAEKVAARLQAHQSVVTHTRFRHRESKIGNQFGEIYRTGLVAGSSIEGRGLAYNLNHPYNLVLHTPHALTPDFLAEEVLPYIQTLTALQFVIDDLRDLPHKSVVVNAIEYWNPVGIKHHRR